MRGPARLHSSRNTLGLICLMLLIVALGFNRFFFTRSECFHREEPPLDGVILRARHAVLSTLTARVMVSKGGFGSGRKLGGLCTVFICIHYVDGQVLQVSASVISRATILAALSEKKIDDRCRRCDTGSLNSKPSSSMLARSPTPRPMPGPHRSTPARASSSITRK